MTAFKRIYIDISGHCNARCRWCVTALKRHVKAEREFMSLEFFERVLIRLQELGALNHDTVIYLHNWGEPTLNKAFVPIANALSTHKIRWGFSTNGAILPDLASIDFSYYTDINISMSGFSQKSYDKIHRLDIGTVKSNIAQYAKYITHIHKKPTIIVYHIYQFNILEIPRAKKFTQELGIELIPYTATFNSYELGIKYLQRALNPKDLYDASRQLLLYHMDEPLPPMQEGFKCNQLEYLVLDEFGTVGQCCSLHRTDVGYAHGSIFDISLEEIARARGDNPACDLCYSTGSALKRPLPVWPA